MSLKKMITKMLGILSAMFLLVVGKVSAVDNGTVVTNPSEGHLPSYEEVNKAKTTEEKKAALINIITIPIVEKNDAILQDKYEASFELMSMSHTKEDAQVLINQLQKQQYWEYKTILMDALSYSPYLDITAPAYRKIAETDEEMFIRGLAIGYLIRFGYESEGFVYIKQLINVMNQTNELVRSFSVINRFKSQDYKEKVKKYFIELKDNVNLDKAVRCFAAVVCRNNYHTEISNYYPLIEEVLLDKETKKNTAIYLLNEIPFSDKNSQEFQKIMQEAAKSNNENVSQVAKEILVVGRYNYK